MKVSESVSQCFATLERTNILATADAAGRANVAAFGSPRLADDTTVVMMLGDNRTYDNLRENPFGALFVMMHGKLGIGMKGCRVYLKVRDMADDGDRFETELESIRTRIGKAADMLKHLVVFDILEQRPILDFGQGL